MKGAGPQFVVCVKNEDFAASLELRKLYEVVADETAATLHQIRVIDESGEDYLFPEECFVPVQIPQSAGMALGSRPSRVWDVTAMTSATKKTYACDCQQCGHKWAARKARPKSCPKCKRYDWQAKASTGGERG